MAPASFAPPNSTLEWVARSIHARAKVIGVRQMVGGITSAVHEVTVETDTGSRHQVVLRRWTGGMPGRDVEVTREAAVLEALDATDVPAPSLIACDPTCAHADAPALLMTRVAGEVNLTPRDPLERIAQQAGMLPTIHALEIEARPFRSWVEVPEEPPAWSESPDLWRQAIEVLRQQPATTDRCFIHRDYQHFNMLWSDEKLSGIVDWTVASIGAPDVDVAHCRLNLAVLFSAELAEQFRLAYEAAAGRELDPWWDVAGLMVFGPGWHGFLPRQVGGRVPVDHAGMNGRVDDLLRYALART